MNKRTATFDIHHNGSPQELRDPRGFAVESDTEEGNRDLVGNNLPSSSSARPCISPT